MSKKSVKKTVRKRAPGGGRKPGPARISRVFRVEKRLYDAVVRVSQKDPHGGTVTGVIQAALRNYPPVANELAAEGGTPKTKTEIRCREEWFSWDNGYDMLRVIENENPSDLQLLQCAIDIAEYAVCCFGNMQITDCVRKATKALRSCAGTPTKESKSKLGKAVLDMRKTIGLADHE